MERHEGQERGRYGEEWLIYCASVRGLERARIRPLLRGVIAWQTGTAQNK
jgi:hypothetical protein